MNIEAILERVKEKPYIPKDWGNIDNPALMEAFWLGHAAKSVQIAETLYRHGVSPEIALKIVEPFLEF